ncbi:radical SAM/SPASM domain-containing protein [Sulfurimonas sp.]|uniref:radical SAM/SPASM domain-containing protein n=1 Tax=Sulfurimonas sp. TaxID=2022749 RepID=UPI00356A240E
MSKKINNVQHSIDTEEREDRFNEIRSYGYEEEYKKNRYEWDYNPTNNIVADYPLHVDLELASVCNLNCPMCYTITDDFKNKVNASLMSFELFKKVIDEISQNNVYSIRLSLRGESSLHKNFIECIKYAKEKGIKEVSTLTAGKKLIDKNFVKQMVEAGIDWITVSVDGVDEVYESIRKPIKFDEIKQALRNIVEIKNENTSIKPAVKIQGIWPAVNKNVNKYLDVFTPLTDLIYTNPLVDYLSLDELKDIEYVTNFKCHQPFQRLVIDSNGKVMACANDQMGSICIGDANTMSVHEIWHSEKMQEFRKDHIGNNAIDKYDICKQCQVPRERDYEEIVIKGKIFRIDNYKNRSQKIGS